MKQDPIQLLKITKFGVTDHVDLKSLKWRAGGYDKKELSNIYTISGGIANKRASLIVNSLLKYVTDINSVKDQRPMSPMKAANR